MSKLPAKIIGCAYEDSETRTPIALRANSGGTVAPKTRPNP